MVIQTCPKCGGDLSDIAYTSYPPIYVKKCFACNFESKPVREEIIHVPFEDSTSDNAEKIETDFDIVSKSLHEHFIIPCDLCNKYFNKNGDCPIEIEQCNSSYHWKLLLERIKENETK